MGSFLSLFILFALTLGGCNRIGIVGKPAAIVLPTPVVTSVAFSNDQIMLTGENLQTVTVAKVEGDLTHTFDIESQNYHQLVLNCKGSRS